MLSHTFCHLPGIGLQRERQLWESGLCRWHDFAGTLPTPRQAGALIRGVRESQDHLSAGNAHYFAACLPSSEQWRMFSAFRHSVAYLDIETTGLGNPGDQVTTIALYDGRCVRHFVQGRNLGEFAAAAREYRLLVTFNGKSFDLPFLRRFLGVELDHAHIDLRHVLRGLGLSGGLKAIERQVGLARSDMADIDGYMAVLLWQEHQRRGDAQVLETLLAYNVQDVLNLEPLMVMAFNAMLSRTPFAQDLQLTPSLPAGNPFRAHRHVIERIQRRWGRLTP